MKPRKTLCTLLCCLLLLGLAPVSKTFAITKTGETGAYVPDTGHSRKSGSVSVTKAAYPAVANGEAVDNSSGQSIPTGEEISEPAQDSGTTYDAQNIWYSADGASCGYVRKDLASGNIGVIAACETGEINLEMPVLIKSVDHIDFTDADKIGVLGHINPSTNAYLIYELETGNLLEEYYGYGFTSKDGVIYYVQAPQHFSGISGSNRILTSKGDLLYESAEDVSILSNIEVVGDTIHFYERDLSSGEVSSCSCSTSNIMYSIGNANYYE